jgi:hypothetical protein
VALCEFPNPETAAWAGDLEVVLERHSFEPSHGDICRASNGQFFCPATCLLSAAAPFCLAADGASTCRAPSCEIPNPETAAWASGQAIQLEKHAEEPSHGDVCRTADGQFFCPTGCTLSTQLPFCVSAADGTSACRAR